jgi:spoIIIJ-associated protein
MESKKDFEKIKKIIEEFFKKMTFEVKIEVGQIKEKVLSLSLKTDDPQILIGGGGRTLIEIQKVLGKILRKRTGEEIFLDLDINQYKKNKIEYLKDLAQSTADEVALSKKEKILPPMPSYERRIIHLTLAEREDVITITESVGKEPERRVVVKPR